MMKSILAALLASSVALALSACGDGSGSDAPTVRAVEEPDANDPPDAPQVGVTPATATPALDVPATETPIKDVASPTPSVVISVPATQTPVLPPDDSDEVPNNQLKFPGCEAITAESHYCLTLSGGRIALLGLDSGHSCPVATTDAPADGFLVGGSIAWQNEYVYVCGDGGLIRVSVRDGSWETGGKPCNSVASYRGGLLVNRWLADLLDPAAVFPFGAPMVWFPTWQAALDETPERSFGLGSFVATMTAQGEKVYTAWHAGKSVDVGDLDKDESLGVLTLQDYNGWMLGMSVTEDGYLVLNGEPWGSTLYIFDAYDGRELKRLDGVAPGGGLACVANASTTPRATPTATPTPTPPTGTPTATPCDPFIDDCSDPCAGLASEPGPFRLHELLPSIPIEMNCLGGGNGSSNYALSDDILTPDATEELHVIGVYEGRGNAGFREHAQGVVDVTVRPRSKPIVLALSSYESMLWRITLEPGAQLARVILQGYDAQEVEGLPIGVPVQHRNPTETCGYAYGWEMHNGGGEQLELMMASLRRLTGLVEISFQGCYAANHFEVPYWSGEPPTGTRTPLPLNESIPREQVQFPGCEAVTAERQYCLTTTFGGLALVGLDSGAVCPIASVGSLGASPDLSSIAWRGEAMYACGYGAGLTRVSLVDGSVEQPQIACSAVTDDGSHLFLTSAPFGYGLDAYPSYAAVLNGEPSAQYSVGADSRMTIHNGRVYSAWHSTNTINVFDLATNQALPPTILEGYDGWILGLAVTDAGELIISGDTWGDTIRIFDVATGAELRELRPTQPVFGLACVTAR